MKEQRWVKRKQKEMKSKRSRERKRKRKRECVKVVEERKIVMVVLRANP